MQYLLKGDVPPDTKMNIAFSVLPTSGKLKQISGQLKKI